jgi:hypothetical protein
LDPLPYNAEMPSLMSATGRVDAHTVVAHFLVDHKIRGDYLEFGVGQGRSTVAALRAYRRADVCRHFHLFDSFRGLPEPQGIDSGGNQFHAGAYAFDEREVQQFLHEHAVWNDEQITFYKGWFEETVPRWAGSPAARENSIAVVHMDMDYYTSCLTVLSAITPLLRTGTVMLFDDWNCFTASNRAGERRAVREWLSKNSAISLNAWFPYGWHGQVFFCDIDSDQVEAK